MNTASLLKPRAIEVESDRSTRRHRHVEPFEPGTGHTLGNALRRILLPRWVGYANRPSPDRRVVHEYSTSEACARTWVDILLNLKGVVFQVAHTGRSDVR